MSIKEGGARGKEPACQRRRRKRRRFNPWVGKISWRRARQPTPAFLPGEPHGQRSLVGHSAWGRTESDTTYVTQHARKKRDSSVYELDYEILVSYLPALYLICFQL